MMTYSHDDFSQFDVTGEDFPFWLLFVLISFGVVGSIVTMHFLIPKNNVLITSNPTMHESSAQNQPYANQMPPKQVGLKSIKAPVEQIPDPTKQGVTFVAEETLPASRLEVKSKPSGTIKNNKTPIAPHISSKDIAEQKTNITSLLPETVEQQNNDSTAKLDSSAEKPELAIAQQSLLQQPATRTQGSDLAFKANDCPPNISFGFARAATTPNSHRKKEKIRQLMDWLQDHPQDTVLITGHTSSRGEEEYNLLLSYRRAKAVTSMLAQAGIAKTRLKVRADGEQTPLHGQPSESRLNRRVSLQIESTAYCMNKEDTKQ